MLENNELLLLASSNGSTDVTSENGADKASLKNLEVTVCKVAEKLLDWTLFPLALVLKRR